MREREYNMDYLRIFACFMVIFLHVSSRSWNRIELTDARWAVFNLYDSAVRSSVPLFLMLSGKFMLSDTGDFSMKEIFRKNIVRIIAVYVFWTLFYGVDSIGITELLKDGFRELPLYLLKPKFHLWYLPAMVSIYLLLPVFKGLIKFEKGRYIPYACMMFLVWGVGKEFLFFIFPENPYLTKFFDNFNYELAGLSGYFLLGYALDRYQERFAKIKTCYLAALLPVIIVISAKAGEYLSLAAGKKSNGLFEYLILPVCAEAILFFMIFLRFPKGIKSEKTRKLISKISKYTLFVYVTHIFVLQLLDKVFHINSMSFNPWLSVPVISVGIFFICMTGAWVTEKIPIAGKWIM